MSDEMEWIRSEALGDGSNESRQRDEDNFFSPQASTVYFSAESLGTISHQDTISQAEIQPKRSIGTQTRRSFVYALKIAEAGLEVMPGLLLPELGPKKDATTDAQELPEAEQRPKTVMYRENSTDAPRDSLLQFSNVNKSNDDLEEKLSEQYSEQTLVPDKNEQDEEDSVDKKEENPIKGILKYSVAQQDNQEGPLVKSSSTQSEFDQDQVEFPQKMLSRETSRMITEQIADTEDNVQPSSRIGEDAGSNDALSVLGQKQSVVFRDSIKRDSKSSGGEPKHVEILPTTSTHILDKPTVRGESLPELIEQDSFIDLRQPETSQVGFSRSKLSLGSRFSLKKPTYLATGNAFVSI